MDERMTPATLHEAAGAEVHGLGRQVLDLVERLCAVGPRPRRSTGLAHARRLLRDALEDAGIAPYHGAEYEASDGSDLVNLLGVVPGRERHLRPLVVATHYDGPAGSPGAGDNGAAVALIVTLAPLLANARLERDVIVALLDGGDADHQPARAHGVEAFMRTHLRHDLKAAVLVDRIGHPVPADVGPGLLAIGVESEPRLPDVLTSIGAVPGWIAPVARRRLGAAPSADAFRANETPYLWITAGHAPHHRGADDRPDRLDEATLRATLATVQALLEALARTRLPGPYVDHDIERLERQAWQAWHRVERDPDGGVDALRSTLPRLGADGTPTSPEEAGG